MESATAQSPQPHGAAAGGGTGLHKLAHPPANAMSSSSAKETSTRAAAGAAASGGIPEMFVMTAEQLAIATLINTLFVGFNMFDVGADMYAMQDLSNRIGFLREFVHFRGIAPVVTQFLVLIILCVPFVMYKLFKEDVRGAWKGDHKYREAHLVGVLNFGCIVGIIFVSVLYIRPFTDRFSDRQKVGDKAAVEMVPELFWIHVGQLLFNIFGIFIPFFRWNAVKKLERNANAKNQ